MAQPPSSPDPRVINLKDQVPDWDSWSAEEPSVAQKMVLGPSPSPGTSEEGKRLKLPELPEDFAARFPQLTHLYLWNLQGLQTLPSLPPGLRCLDVRGCAELVSLPELPGTLETLDLGDCTLVSALPAVPATGLPRLTRVYLNGCSSLLSFAPFRCFVHQLKELLLHGCKFEDLDSALCGEPRQNVASQVSAHFRALEEQGAASLPECKVVVLGNGGVGKTSLVRALKGLPHRTDEPSTDGIRLWSWDADGFVPFASASGAGELVQLNIWDFGGQDLYHNTHRLFLESRAIFLVVWRQPPRDGRPFRPQFPNDPVRPLNYWLDQVFAAHPDAQVVVVRTGADEDSVNPPEDWRTQVRLEYRKLPGFEVSGLEAALGQRLELKDAIRSAVVTELRSAAAIQIGKGRRAVRAVLRAWQPAIPDDELAAPVSKRPLLRLHEFVDLVHQTYRGAGLGEPSAMEPLLLLDYLHHSGALYCPKSWQENSELKGAFPVIVDQRWAIEGIYRLFAPGELRDRLIARQGQVPPHFFASEVWTEVKTDGTPVYSEQARWVFVRFMMSCGVLLRVHRAGDQDPRGTFILPEYLPDYSTLADAQASDPLVAATTDDPNARLYRIEDRTLGPGFGCLLVRRLAEMFGKVPLFRYGAIGRVAVGGEGSRRTDTALELVARIEWGRRHQNAYQGDLVVKLFGPPGHDGEVLGYLLEELQKIPSFPGQVQFRSESSPQLPGVILKHGYVQLPPRTISKEAQEPSVRARPREGVLGISTAGDNEGGLGIELLPRALERGLNSRQDRRFDVIFYRSNTTFRTLPGLISRLIESDLMLAFVGHKYLHSEYCLAELVGAAKRFQAEETFENPQDWPNFVWVYILPDAGPLLQRNDLMGVGSGDAVVQAWLSSWISKAGEYWLDLKTKHGGRRAGGVRGAAECAYHAWMEFAEDEGERGLRAVLAAVRNALPGWKAEVPPASLVGTARKDWADKLVQPLVEKAVEQLNRIVESATPEEREKRWWATCLRLHADGHRELAADAFENAILQRKDYASVRQAALQAPLQPYRDEIESVRQFWVSRQGG